MLTVVIIIIIIIKKRAIVGGVTPLILFAGYARAHSAADVGRVLNACAVDTGGLFAVKGCGVDAFAVGPAFNAGVCFGVAYRGLSGAIAIAYARITDVIVFVTQCIA